MTVDMMEKQYIYPTNRCFDDALDLMVTMWYRENSGIHLRRMVRLAHGICHHDDTGEPFAHAWLERQQPDGRIEVWQCGYSEGTEIAFSVDKIDFYRAMKIIDVTFYGFDRARKLNRKYGHYGPWLERYERLTNNPQGVDRVIKKK